MLDRIKVSVNESGTIVWEISNQDGVPVERGAVPAGEWNALTDGIIHSLQEKGDPISYLAVLLLHLENC